MPRLGEGRAEISETGGAGPSVFASKNEGPTPGFTDTVDRRRDSDLAADFVGRFAERGKQCVENPTSEYP